MALETTDFEDVLREAASEVTALDPDNLDAAEFRAFRRSAKRRLEIAWEFHYWPVLARIEQRFYRPDFDSAVTYAVGDIVYYPGTQKYYQSLLDGNNGDAFPDAPLWTEAQTSFSASEWVSTATYQDGDRAQFSGNVYQVHSGPALAGDQPDNATIWGLLVPFDKFIPYEQTGKTPLGVVTAAWSANPRVTTRGNELNWNLSENGVQVITPINYAWLEYRLRCPKISGDLWDSGRNYLAGQQMYYISPGTPGNFYTANAITGAGYSPETNPGLWAKLAIPRIFHKYLVHGLAADWISGAGGGNPQDVAVQMEIANASLDDQKSLLVGQQSQRIKTVVRTR